MPKIIADKDGRVIGFSAVSADKRLESLLDRLTKPQRRISTGWPLLDKALHEPGTKQGGFMYPSFVVLGAEPQGGKSLWTQIIAERHSESGGFVYHIDLENGEERYFRRLMYRAAQIGNAELTKGLEGKSKERWDSAIKKWRNVGKRLFVAVKPPKNPTELRAHLEEFKLFANGEKIVVIIDSLQKLPTEDLAKERRQGVEIWLKALESMRGELDIVIMVISELKRPTNAKRYEANILSFKETGEIEYTADLALTMTRIEPEKDKVELAVVKGRDDFIGPVAYYEPIRPYFNMIETPILGGNDGVLNEDERYWSAIRQLTYDDEYTEKQLAKLWKKSLRKTKDWLFRGIDERVITRVPHKTSEGQVLFQRRKED